MLSRYGRTPFCRFIHSSFKGIAFSVAVVSEPFPSAEILFAMRMAPAPGMIQTLIFWKSSSEVSKEYSC